MARAKKDSLEAQYRTALASAGIRYEDCEVLCFGFPNEQNPARFHYDILMSVSRPSYRLFDSKDKQAIVIIDKGDRMSSKKICDIARFYQGEQRTPNLR